jgi:uncharacterized MAPEG superfamily protein
MISIPLLALPLGLVLVYLPKIPLSLAMAREPEGYNNNTPRDQQAKLTGWGRRAAAAHANGFESFPAFAVGALAAHVTGADPKWAAVLATTYLVARFLYALLYIGGVAPLRSLVWVTGFGATLGLMILPLLR